MKIFRETHEYRFIESAARERTYKCRASNLLILTRQTLLSTPDVFIPAREHGNLIILRDNTRGRNRVESRKKTILTFKIYTATTNKSTPEKHAAEWVVI